MELIPVVDLMRGQAVLARGGRRREYQPLRPPRCRSSDPLAVVESFLALHPFKTLYLADLDAILGHGDNGIIIARIRRRFPRLTLWIDRGWPPVSAASGLVPVVGSESLSRHWRRHLSRMRAPWILSLDFKGEKFLGPGALLHTPRAWPQRVILMSLDRVGESSGPDWRRLQHLTRRHPGIDWIAAGGIRNREDLTRLGRLKVRHALVSTALHQGTLPHRKRAALLPEGGS